MNDFWQRISTEPSTPFRNVTSIIQQSHTKPVTSTRECCHHYFGKLRCSCCGVGWVQEFSSASYHVQNAPHPIEQSIPKYQLGIRWEIQLRVWATKFMSFTDNRLYFNWPLEVRSSLEIETDRQTVLEILASYCEQGHSLSWRSHPWGKPSDASFLNHHVVKRPSKCLFSSSLICAVLSLGGRSFSLLWAVIKALTHHCSKWWE